MHVVHLYVHAWLLQALAIKLANTQFRQMQINNIEKHIKH